MSEKPSKKLTLDLPSPYNGMVMTKQDGSEFHVGYSRISKFAECPKQFKYSYVDKLRRKAGLPLLRGQAYHGSVETMLQWKIDHPEEPYTIERAERLAIRMARKEELTDAEIYKIIDAVRYYYITLYHLHDPMLVECDFSVARGGVTITGRIDLVENGGAIVDHKFSYDTWAISRAKYGCQPIIYQWAAMDQLQKQYPNWRYTHFEYNIIKLYPHPKIQCIKIPALTQDQSDWWEDQIHEYAKTIRRGYFPAKPADKACTFCDFKDLCKPAIYMPKLSFYGGATADDEDID